MKTEHDMILDVEHTDFTTMSKIGTVKISQGDLGLRIEIEGFEFSDSTSCRQHAARVLAWARDVVENACHAEQLTPGGTITTVLD